MANLVVALFASLGAVATAQKAAAPATEMAAYQGSYPSYASPPVAEMPAYPSHRSSPAATPSLAPSPSPPTMAAPTASPPSPASSPSAGWRRLRVGYYRRSCPRAENIVREAVTVRNATSKNAGLGAGIFRMHFHDCFVQGCHASVLLDPTAANPAGEAQPTQLPKPAWLRSDRHSQGGAREGLPWQGLLRRHYRLCCSRRVLLPQPCQDQLQDAGRAPGQARVPR
uniref:Plant heme peroxidase family profile domain-containing protein n=1 Tax=Triticum urartu TaxID=4572 RepID=A0A8R7RDR6_TRIUA